MKTNDWKLVAAIIIAILAAGISEASRPGARDGSVAPENDRSDLIQIMPMDPPGHFDPYADRLIRYRLCLLRQGNVLQTTGMLSAVFLCALPQPVTFEAAGSDSDADPRLEERR